MVTKSVTDPGVYGMLATLHEHNLQTKILQITDSILEGHNFQNYPGDTPRHPNKSILSVVHNTMPTAYTYLKISFVESIIIDLF